MVIGFHLCIRSGCELSVPAMTAVAKVANRLDLRSTRGCKIYTGGMDSAPQSRGRLDCPRATRKEGGDP